MSVQVRQTVRVVDPITEPTAASGFAYASRLRDLRGKRVGIIDDSKRNARELLEAIYDELNREFGFAGLFYHRKPSSSLVVAPAVLAEMTEQCDFIIVGIGD